jgi:hypothetical protein
MNTNLLNIVKRIAAEQGEGILGDPQRLKSFFSDLAKEESKPLRIAFGRCVEAGAYNALKTAQDSAERAEHKTTIAQRVRDEHGLDITLCGEALDILEAALYDALPTKPPQASPQQPQYILQRYQQPQISHRQTTAYQQPNNASTRAEEHGRMAAAGISTNRPIAAPAKKKHILHITVIGGAILLAVIVLLLVVPDTNLSLNSWRGYATFKSFSRAINIDKLEKPFTEEDFKTAMSLFALAYYLSGDELSYTLDIVNILFTGVNGKIDNIDILSGKDLTIRYGVSEALRKDNNYLLKRDIIKRTVQIAYFDSTAWIVLSVSAKQK